MSTGGVDEFEMGDLVWAKMKGFSSWPGRVTSPKSFLKKPNLKTDMQCIFFFGTHNYAYIEKTNIKPYLECKAKFIKGCKSTSLREAIDDIEDYIKRREEDPEYNPEENIKQSIGSADEESVEAEDDEEEEEDDDEEADDEPKAKKKRKSNVARTPRGKFDSTPSLEKNGPVSKDKDSTITKMESKTKSEEGKGKREPTRFILGCLGLGRMGKNIVLNLVRSGHKVNIWNRTIEKANTLKNELDEKHPGLVQVFQTPSDIARNSDIIFSCLADFNAVKNVWYGEFGLNEVENYDGKGYVELTNIGTDNSLETDKLIANKCGNYLEAQLQGGVQEAEDGKLVLLVAGNEKLYDDCNSCFEAIGKTIFYLGKVGSATKMNLILQVMRGVAMVGLQESFALATKGGLMLKDVLEIFAITTMNSPFLQHTASSLVEDDVELEHQMRNIRADIKMALEFSDVLKQPLVMAAAANESILKQLNS